MTEGHADRGERRGKVTITAIAREAGVSVPTVSRVVNGRSDVAPRTRARVEDLLQPARLPAKVDRARRPAPRLVDLVFNDLDSPWAVEIIRGVEEVAHAAGIGTVVSAIHRPLGRRAPVDARTCGPAPRTASSWSPPSWTRC